MDKIALLDELVEKIAQLNFGDVEGKGALASTADLYARKFFGDNSQYIKRISKVNFSPIIYPCDTNTQRNCWEGGKTSLKNIVLTMKKELALDSDMNSAIIPASAKKETRDIFIVHGHDEAMKLDVARTIEKLGYNSVILHEQPDKGRNVLVKLIEESDNCGFAIVLLSPDDYGYPVNADDSNRKTRARQNVVLELGYFMGKLRPDRVVVLYKDASDFEIPSDFVGTLYKKYDESGSWKLEVARELKAAGFSVDANKLIE